ncbi:MAG: aminotransferase class III-fold pyridoxal phosphate-dependent enzyme [Planctomycetes bacterium]|nr:aminotransferase class III-fold pyridoxal phosphate-dependent enzyme [Planctomycetota bacterium]
MPRAAQPFQAGTLSGNPLVMAAGLAALRELRRADPYEAWEDATAEMGEALREAAERINVGLQFQAVGNMFTIVFSDQPIENYNQARSANAEAFSRFYRRLLRQGVLAAPSPYEACFLSTCHLDERTLAEFRSTLVDCLVACADQR